MRYKTIVLELLQGHPEIHSRLQSNRLLLRTLELFARELKTSHEAWKVRLAGARPGSDPSQTAAEALEVALKELEDTLCLPSAPDQGEPFPLTQAMAFVRGRTPPE